MAEGVVLARIYNQSVQRVPCNLAQLNSHAAFIFTCLDAGKIVLWIGELCSVDDVSAGHAIVSEIVYADFQENAAVDTIIEGQETDSQLSDLMDILLMQVHGEYKYIASNFCVFCYNFLMAFRLPR